jgi:hypothetical protein
VPRNFLLEKVDANFEVGYVNNFVTALILHVLHASFHLPHHVILHCQIQDGMVLWMVSLHFFFLGGGGGLFCNRLSNKRFYTRTVPMRDIYFW